MVPETWRVVFSSTGDLAPAGTAARADKTPSRRSILAARFATAVPISSQSNICSASLLRPSGEPFDFGSEKTVPVCGTSRRVRPPSAFSTFVGNYDATPLKLLHLGKREQLRPAATLIAAVHAEAVRGPSFSGSQPRSPGGKTQTRASIEPRHKQETIALTGAAAE